MDKKYLMPINQLQLETLFQFLFEQTKKYLWDNHGNLNNDWIFNDILKLLIISKLV